MLLVHAKHDTYVMDGDTVEDAAFRLLRERLTDGYWYYNADDGDRTHQYEDRARSIVDRHSLARNDADRRHAEVLAWRFLQERNHFEYELVEKAVIR